jgi:hypothetical protein
MLVACDNDRAIVVQERVAPRPQLRAFGSGEAAAGVDVKVKEGLRQMRTRTHTSFFAVARTLVQ